MGRTALLVDDDARNIFALSSVLERRGMKVLTATTGSEAVTLVGSNPEIAVVLMDIMMPQMDGYQTIGVIRSNPEFRRLPIIALTAKAMKGRPGRNASRPGPPTISPSRSIPSNCCSRSECGFIADWCAGAGLFEVPALWQRVDPGTSNGRATANFGKWHSMTDQEKVDILLVDDQPAKLLAYEVILKELGGKPRGGDVGTGSAGISAQE